MATTWNENKPEATDPLSELPSVFTTNAIRFRQAIEKHSYWTDSSGLSAGQTRFSDGSFGPGSFRAFYDVQSNLSSALSTVKPLAGRLYLASDTKHLFGFGSLSTVTSYTTMALGSRNMVAYLGSSQATIQSNVRVLIQYGSITTTVGSSTVTFGTAYTVTPVVQLQPMSSTTTLFAIAQANVVAADHFSLSLQTVYGSSANITVMWKSYGTAAL